MVSLTGGPVDSSRHLCRRWLVWVALAMIIGPSIAACDGRDATAGLSAPSGRATTVARHVTAIRPILSTSAGDLYRPPTLVSAVVARPVGYRSPASFGLGALARAMRRSEIALGATGCVISIEAFRAGAARRVRRGRRIVIGYAP